MVCHKETRCTWWCMHRCSTLLEYGCLQTLPAKGAHHAVRGQTLMAAIKHPEMPQASAATAASNAAGKLQYPPLFALLGRCCNRGCCIKAVTNVRTVDKATWQHSTKCLC